jgi:hypothetical protein
MKMIHYGIAIALVVVSAIAIVLLIDVLLFMSCVDYEEVFHSSRFVPTKVLRQKISYKLVICCLARNSAKHFANSRARVEAIGRSFEDYVVLIFENDSSDNTRYLIKQWAVENPRIKLIQCADAVDCKLSNPEGYDLENNGKQKVRMANMVKFRNRYLNKLQCVPQEFTHVFIYDFDCRGPLDLDAVARVMDIQETWDVVSVNKLSYGPPFYSVPVGGDFLAYLSPNGSVQDAMKQTMSQRNTEILHLSKSKRQLEPVRSAFGGGAFYQRKALVHNRYKLVDDDLFGCEHIGLHLSMAKNGFNRQFVAPSCVLFTGQQGNPNRWGYVSKFFQSDL